MDHPSDRIALTFKLYLKLSAVLIPSFLAISAFGLYLLTNHIVDEAKGQLGIRIGNAAARVAGGLERLSEIDTIEDGRPIAAAQELMLVLMSDPAVQCAELIEPGVERPMLSVPVGLGCRHEVYDTTLTIPLYFPDDADLVVRSSLDEIDVIRRNQQDISMFILIAGLIIAMLTNWLTFRFIIGRPLKGLIAEIDHARQKAEETALQDGLTGLANRRHLDSYLEGQVEAVNAGGAPFSVLHIDLDHFKEINDTIGHAAGDAVLRHVSRALRNETRKDDFVARAGGDEFVIVTPRLSDRAELSQLASRIISAVEKPVNFRGDLCKVSASIGLDIVGTPAGFASTTAERVLMNADIALYRAKELGRAGHVFFETELRRRVEESKKLADDLIKALDRDEITCFYHPQHDPETLRIRGAEALVRWVHPERGVLPPETFLKTAERLSIVDKIDEIVLRKAVDDLARWDALGLGIEAVSVNVSSDRLKDPNLIDKLKRIDMPRGRIIFEILETAFVDDISDEVRWTLDSVRELGIEIEIDDFGTGKASILGVLALNPQRLKIAKEIVLPLPELESQRALVRAIVSLAKTLNVGLIAEGVESRAHLDILREMNFSKFQGYLLSRPMLADDIIQMVRQADGTSTEAAAG